MQSETPEQKTSKTFSPPRLAVAAVAVVAAVAALSVGPSVAPAQAVVARGGCDDFVCGNSNHNEAMATTGAP